MGNSQSRRFNQEGKRFKTLRIFILKQSLQTLQMSGPVGSHDDVVRISREQGWPRPQLVADRQRDFVPAIFVSGYERHAVVVDIRYPLKAIVWKPSTREVLDAVRGTHFVILTTEPPGAQWAYPFDRKLASLHPRLRRYCDRRLALVGTYHVPEQVRLYARTRGQDGPQKPAAATAKS